MDRGRHLALLVTRIYGATFIALSFGWGIAGAVLLLLGAVWWPHAESYLITAVAHFIAGVLVIAFSRRVAAFAARP